MIRSLLIVALVGSASSQYVQQASRAGVQQQAAQAAQQQQQPVDDQIPAWYQMAKPVQAARALPQASPSYYERHEPTYEQRREQAPTYERPGIQTNQYANYPSYSNRQPYENLNALTSGASLSNLQASRRYPATAGAAGSDMPYDSALKRYHKLLLKRRQWTTKIGRILASTTPMTPSTTTTTTAPTTTTPVTTTKKMPKSLKSIYSTINPRTTTEEVTTEATTARAKVTPRLVGKPRGTFKPHGTRKGWRMWKKVTPKYVAKLSTTTTEAPTSSTTSTTELSTSSSSRESSVASGTSTTSTDSTTSTSTTSEPVIPELPLIEEEQEVTTTEEPTTEEATTPTTTSTTTTTTTEPAPTTNEDRAPSRYICQHKAGSNEHDPFSERRASTMGPFRPIAVGHKWKPLRFKKPEPSEVTTIPEGVATKPRGLRLLEYLLPNTELLAAIKDVVAKFKASLDEAGIDQDVRLMGNQLKNTWQQLRTGPMNEQIGRLFEKAVADAADQKQAQQLQQIQQQLAPTRP